MSGQDVVRTMLLIVPYGIETSFTRQGTAKRVRLLIVPYGIETLSGTGRRTRRGLLIVPYGIET